MESHSWGEQGIHKGPAKRTDDVDAVFVDGLEHFAQEGLVVVGAFEVVELRYGGLGAWVSRDLLWSLLDGNGGQLSEEC